MKKIYSIFAILMMMTVALGFTSCSSDDDSKTIFYSMGFSSYSYHGSSMSEMEAEMEVVEDAFQEALGVNKNDFTMTGSSKSCDKDVVAKCKAAEASLSGRTFKSSFTFKVTNVNDNKAVYNFTK